MGKHFAQPETDNRLLAIAAARLRSAGLNQLQIAKRLERSQPEISRLLDYAERHEFLARAPTFLSHNVEPEDLLEANRRFFLPEQLQQRLSRLVPQGLHFQVELLPDGDDEFASAAASCVARLLRRARVVGVMWGRTVRRVVSRIGEHRAVFDQDGGGEAQCIPLCGDPVHLMNLRRAEDSASHVAAELGRAINPERASDQPCLVGVPAYVSRRWVARLDAASASWLDFVREIPGYRAIFGPSTKKDEPWTARLDTILTGMGIIASRPHPEAQAPHGPATAAHEETGDFIRERLVQEHMNEPRLARLIYGDIGGWLIERHGIGAADRRLVASLNQGWTGLNDAHFAAVARRARPDGAPGVILVVAGAAKAEMVREVVRRGLVNVLLIDSALASALELIE